MLSWSSCQLRRMLNDVCLAWSLCCSRSKILTLENLFLLVVAMQFTWCTQNPQGPTKETRLEATAQKAIERSSRNGRSAATRLVQHSRVRTVGRDGQECVDAPTCDRRAWDSTQELEVAATLQDPEKQGTAGTIASICFFFYFHFFFCVFTFLVFRVFSVFHTYRFFFIVFQVFTHLSFFSRFFWCFCTFVFHVLFFPFSHLFFCQFFFFFVSIFHFFTFFFLFAICFFTCFSNVFAHLCFHIFLTFSKFKFIFYVFQVYFAFFSE